MNNTPAVEKFITIVSNICAYGLLLLIPIFFLPTTQDFFTFNKRILVFAVAAVSVLLWVVRIAVKKEVKLTISPLFIPSLLFFFSIVLSGYKGSIYSYEMWMDQGLLFGSLTALVLALPMVMQSFSPMFYTFSLTIPAVVLSLFATLQLVGINTAQWIGKLTGLPLDANGNWSLAGNSLAAVMFLVVVAVLNIVQIFARSEYREKVVHGVLTSIVLIGIVVHAYTMFPGKPSALLMIPLQASWSIAMDVLKIPSTALFGVGPESYSVAYRQFHPALINLDNVLWDKHFTTARIEPLNILTTLGVIGFITWVLFLLSVIRFALPINKHNLPLVTVLAAGIALQLIFPTNIILSTILYVTVALLIVARKHAHDRRVSETSFAVFSTDQHAGLTSRVSNSSGYSGQSVPSSQNGSSGQVAIQPAQAISYLFALIVCVGVAAAGSFVSKIYATERMLLQSMIAAQNGDAAKTLEIQTNMVNAQPMVDRYHRELASTTFRIAVANLSNQKELSEEQKAQVSQLLQFSIQQAKIATDLDPRKAENWAVSTVIYRGIVGVVQGPTDQWAVSAFVRTIQADPINPSLRFELGSLYLLLQNYDQAARMFEQTVELKSNWANAYYNLGFVYKQQKKYADAYLALQSAQKYLDPSTPDADKEALKKEIADLAKTIEEEQKRLAEEAKKQQEQAAKGSAGQNGQKPNAQGAANGSSNNQQEQKSKIPQGNITIPENLGLPEEEPPTTVPQSTTPLQDNENQQSQTSASPSPTPAASPAASSTSSASSPTPTATP